MPSEISVFMSGVKQEGDLRLKKKQRFKKPDRGGDDEIQDLGPVVSPKLGSFLH